MHDTLTLLIVKIRIRECRPYLSLRLSRWPQVERYTVKAVKETHSEKKRKRKKKKKNDVLIQSARNDVKSGAI